MKNKFFKSLILIITLSTVLFSFKVYKQDSSIIGVWKSESDTEWKIKFETNDLCSWYYENVQTDVYSYVLSNSSPKCNQTVLVNSKTNYLTLTNNDDINDKICYEIYSISSSKLTLREINSSGFLIFNKE